MRTATRDPPAGIRRVPTARGHYLSTRSRPGGAPVPAAARGAAMQIAIALYEGLTILDAIGPYQVLTRLPGAEVVLVAAERGRLSDDLGLLHLEIEHTFDEVTRPDVIVVPGGMITR